MAKYRAGIIGLGWIGFLAGLAERESPEGYSVEDVYRPTPEINVHRRFHHHEHPGKERMFGTYAEALWERPEVDLIAGADREEKRLKGFGERYGIEALYTDAAEMLRNERLDLVAVATNVRGRADLACLAVEHGAKGILTEKPMAHTLEEADRMVKMCAEAGVPLNCGNITATHPSFARAKELVRGGAIGDVVSIEAGGPGAQHQNWSYFVDSAPAWAIGFGDTGRREDEQSTEFAGQGMMVTVDGQIVHFRAGAPLVRLTGTKGEIVHDWAPHGWRLWQRADSLAGELDPVAGRKMVEMPWPEPQIVYPYGGVYALADVIDCMEGRLDEPKNSGRRVAVALEVEIACKVSAAKGGVRVDLPLQDRSLGLKYSRYR